MRERPVHLSESVGLVSRGMHRSTERHPELRRVRPRLRERRGVRRRGLRVRNGLAPLRQWLCRSGEQPGSLRRLRHGLRSRSALRIGPLYVPARPDSVQRLSPCGLLRGSLERPGPLRRLQRRVRAFHLVHERHVLVQERHEPLWGPMRERPYRSAELRRLREAVPAGTGVRERNVRLSVGSMDRSG
jgi:hypothetical protein